ncbi:hypothetical protein C1646_744824 [Rhizophagus diaphanus]|nr:hypothetical protein C1646_744824 [Rhizophagus diaphanus] [Rhizophagus sp. MUCL 43196]
MDNLEMNKVEENYTSSSLFTSKIHNFGNLPKPRNATEEEQEDSNKKLSKLFKKLQLKSNNDEKEETQKYIDDDDDVYNNSNLHSNEQDEFEIPDDRNYLMQIIKNFSKHLDTEKSSSTLRLE